ncbi:MAG TPA: bifunctional DNA-formamidopyrimidine glycosylase/DNA-(apurinic or apyrimidinic site) lyase [Gordonia sp. (in: high G+C Gram-positive bacteria)]|uniref:bifunctional DNA-formamidopyrimidine glycosylase/DNA-(apurinic or apyrimidinic site) lyase n=2 Tax=Gordonia TaxID=2053 RepID=UPI000FA461C3|nr:MULTISPECIES: bifunctional DNA-formamidopyrimidine glycosylase/DNA-(apurinic or apyrimidinic site) lyase [unclassified Gordonia (in: high G+C Gram-positive bacteria)]RUP40644.1 MAG: bifunctional DNA-formamidopyrimidine glycosylase/DNA-(apurinic or apyrimidinic site) lyase [Gordonia sp. (in: high G+C Gram-positive bacteria)]HNP59051.1 bifunctional DNA-formamidopyrimidine glycosylase/DNA-(apurinic or apyrimidinic site) lyase [Gordonia sp. (in: high G+C Gram-positive bacteria)]HRC52729.1 bifunct
MPELPEVETVRLGVDKHVVGRSFSEVRVHHDRAVRRQAGGAAELVGRLTGTTAHATRRRGKYLWLELADEAGIVDEALVIHLGMSGQLRIIDDVAATEPSPHLRISTSLGDRDFWFVDQRTFGGWQVDELVPDVYTVGASVPSVVAHIAPDPFDPAFDAVVVASAMRRKHTEVKRALLDQTLVSGIGNIYADEALWRARLRGTRLTDSISRAKLVELLGHARDVMAEALAVGGTSFDELYVNVNGESGYFARSLNAYGREGEPCYRCGSTMRREQFMNRSSFYCAHCQRSARGR